MAIVDYLDRNGLEALHSSTQIIIAPGYTYKIVKMLVTNFHQPQGTLLLLVSAFLHGDWKKVYDYALSHDFRFLSYGDSSLLIQFGQEISPEINAQITAFVHLMREQHVEGVTDVIPAFSSLLINYDPRVIDYRKLKRRLEKLLKLEVSKKASSSRIFEIPVCYGGEYGPDLENIAKHANLTPQEVIDIHSSSDYLIYMLGFLPGFSYLGGWMNASTLRVWQIRVSKSQPEASASAVPRPVSIR